MTLVSATAGFAPTELLLLVGGVASFIAVALDLFISCDAVPIAIACTGAIVGFRIDRGRGAAIDYSMLEGVQPKQDDRFLTCRLFPVPSRSTSRPPGPRLLLLDFFFVAASPRIDRLLLPPKLPMSVVMFSLSIPSNVGVCESDLRDFGLVAGRVTSLREAMAAVAG
jgi:hypothetical protein